MLGKARASGKNTAALWTFTANPYRKLGKQGQVNCLHFVAGTDNNAVGLRILPVLMFCPIRIAGCSSSHMCGWCLEFSVSFGEEGEEERNLSWIELHGEFYP